MTLVAPRSASSRNQARKLAAGLPDDLTGAKVVVDCSQLRLSNPSFIDELIGILVQRRGATLLLADASADLRLIAAESATERGVTTRVDFS